jgi:hypothetical protein
MTEITAVLLSVGIREIIERAFHIHYLVPGWIRLNS